MLPKYSCAAPVAAAAGPGAHQRHILEPEQYAVAVDVSTGEVLGTRTRLFDASGQPISEAHEWDGDDLVDAEFEWTSTSDDLIEGTRTVWSFGTTVSTTDAMCEMEGATVRCMWETDGEPDLVAELRLFAGQLIMLNSITENGTSVWHYPLTTNCPDTIPRVEPPAFWSRCEPWGPP